MEKWFKEVLPMDVHEHADENVREFDGPTKDVVETARKEVKLSITDEGKELH